MMTQNSSSPVTSKPLYTIIGALLGAVIALTFAKTGNPGLIGVGAVLGVSIGNALYRRFNKND